MQPLPRSGLEQIPHLRWGSHLAHFYSAASELTALLVPYFRAGLENGEQCLWVTCDPLGTEQARTALLAALPDLAARERDGQIEIVDDSAFYAPGKTLEPEALVAGLVQREQAALARGFAGLRGTGNCTRAARAGWVQFLDYERRLQEALRGRRMICLCSYCLDHLEDGGPIEIMQRHDLALAGATAIPPLPPPSDRKSSPTRAPAIGSEQALQEWEQQKRTFQLAMTAARMGTWRYRLADRICVYDENAQRLYGLTAAEFLHDEEGVKTMIHPDDLGLMWERVASAVDPNGDGRYDMEYRVRQLDGSWRWLSAWGLTEFEGDGPSRKPIAIAGASRDLTEPKETEAVQRSLLHSLNERLNTTLASIQAITSQRASASNILDARIAALDKTNAQLRSSLGAEPELAKVIARALDGFPADQLRLSGRAIKVPPRLALGLSTALHELAINAASHGALSCPEGRVTIRWEAQDGKLRLDWRESGGPPVTPPKQKGFGTRLLERLLVGDLGGDLKLDDLPTGLSFSITLML